MDERPPHPFIGKQCIAMKKTGGGAKGKFQGFDGYQQAIFITLTTETGAVMIDLSNIDELIITDD